MAAGTSGRSRDGPGRPVAGPEVPCNFLAPLGRTRFARKWGFCDASHLQHLYRNHYGTSPARERNALRGC